MLPSSIYATPGRRAYGFGDVLPDDDEYAGLHRAPLAATNLEEPCRPPLFGTAHTKLGSKMKGASVTELFFSTEIIHPPDNPERPAHRGLWAAQAEEVLFEVRQEDAHGGEKQAACHGHERAMPHRVLARAPTS